VALDTALSVKIGRECDPWHNFRPAARLVSKWFQLRALATKPPGGAIGLG
jgi:hypothetical protein